MPVFDNRKVLIGYLVGAIRLTGENFLAALSKTEIGEEGYMYLLRPDRKFINGISKVSCRGGELTYAANPERELHLYCMFPL
jgi:hypothetical protein